MLVPFSPPQADLDLGNYERFLDVTLTRDNNLTTGKVYQVRQRASKPTAWKAAGECWAHGLLTAPHPGPVLAHLCHRLLCVPVCLSSFMPELACLLLAPPCRHAARLSNRLLHGFMYQGLQGQVVLQYVPVETRKYRLKAAFQHAVDMNLPRCCCVPPVQSVLDRERRGDYLGKTVQVGLQPGGLRHQHSTAQHSSDVQT